MISSSRRVPIWGVVPAAGMSRRMGVPKQSLPYRDSTMAAAVVRVLIDADLAGIVVVTRTELVGALDLPKDSRVHLAINDDPNSEMIDSIRIGLDRLAGEGIGAPARAGAHEQVRDTARAETRGPVPPRGLNPGVLVVSADMPSLSADACRKCMAAFIADPDRIVIATHAGKRGHPIVFPLGLRATLEGLNGGLRELPKVHADRVQLVETGDPGVVQDVDTLEDYRRAAVEPPAGGNARTGR